MRRIDTATKAVDLFGAGKHGFKDGDPALAILATKLNAAFFNSAQEELASVVEAAGLGLNPADNTQLLQAIRLLPGRVLGKSIAGGANVTLTAYESQYPMILLTGVITANINVIVPNAGREWVIANGTTGAFTVTVKTAAGSGVAVAQGASLHLYCDLANVNQVGVVAGEQTVQGSFKNLFAAASGLSAAVVVTADEIVVKDSAGNAQLLSNLALSINTATTGANGLDTGAVAASSWYSIWAIWNGATKAGVAALCPVLTGTTTAGSPVVTALASTSSMRVGMPFAGGSFPVGTVIKSVDSASQITASQTAVSAGSGVSLRFVYDPIMPSGYTCKARTGMFFTDGTANKFPLSFLQAGRRIQWKLAAASNLVALPSLAAGIQGSPTAPTWVAVSVSLAAPPTASAIYVNAHVATLGKGVLVAPNSNYGSYASTVSTPPIALSVSSSMNLSSSASIALESANIFYASDDSVGSVICNGYEDNL